MERVLVHTHDFVEEAAQFIRARIVEGLATRPMFVLGLCGGSTPAPVYVRLAAFDDLLWNRILISFSDERCVPPDHQDSNYRMAKEALFNKAFIPAENILRMEGELPPEDAAAKYEQLLRKRLGDAPIHDLLLLGMGGDGHTASLFPGTEALGVRDRLVIANPVPQHGTIRLTATYPLINAARRVCFLVRDESKRSVVEEVFAGKDYPSTHVAGTVETVWMLGW